MLEDERIEMERLRTKNLETESRVRQLEMLLESKDRELIKVGLQAESKTENTEKKIEKQMQIIHLTGTGITSWKTCATS